MLFILLITLMLKSSTCAPFSPAASLYNKINVASTQNDQHTSLRFDGLETTTSVVNLHRRDSSHCSLLTSNDVKKLPGWTKIDNYVRKTYGSGHANIVTNPSEYPSRGAIVCIDIESVPVQIDGKPTCSSHLNKIQGRVSGVNTSALTSIVVSQGYSNTGTWTVDQSASIAVSASFSVGFNIPEIIYTGLVTTTGTFTNSNSHSFTTSIDTTLSQTFTMTIPPNKSCFGQITTKTCEVGGKAKIRLIASGWVWYNFDTKTPSSGKGDKHYKWAIKIEDVLRNIDDRSSWVNIVGSMHGEAKSDYEGVCA